MNTIIRLASVLVSVTGLGCVHHEASPLRQFGDLKGMVSAVAWSPDERLMASGWASGIIQIWDVESGREIARTAGYERHGSEYEVCGMSFSPDGQWLAFGGADGVVRLWRFGDGSTRKLIGQRGSLLRVRFSPDGKRLATASGGFTYLHAAGPSTAPILRTPSQPDARAVVEPMAIVVFDVESGEVASRVDASGFLDVAFSPDLTFFAGPGLTVTSATTWPIGMGNPELRSGNAQVRGTATGRIIREFPSRAWWTEFSPDGKLLLAGGTVYELPSGKALRKLNANAKVFADNQVLVVNSGIGLPSELLGGTRWVNPVYVSPRSGWKHDTGKYVTRRGITELWKRSLDEALMFPSQYSPSRKYAVDRWMGLWRVPQ